MCFLAGCIKSIVKKKNIREKEKVQKNWNEYIAWQFHIEEEKA